jgi:nucleotide-binding universal stress UspA family protein
MDFFGGLHILVPVDFSVESRRAVNYTIQLADRPNHVHVLHVCPSLILYEPAAVFVLREDEIRARYREVFQKHFPAEAFGELEFDLQFGDPGSQIAAYAAVHQMGLIVMPTHGRTGLDRLLMGSVAERTMRLASCPVLVLRGDCVQSLNPRASA